MDNDAKQATPHDVLITQIMSHSFAKEEMGWAAHKEITKLRAELEKLNGLADAATFTLQGAYTEIELLRSQWKKSLAEVESWSQAARQRSNAVKDMSIAMDKLRIGLKDANLQVDEARIAFTAIVMATGDSTNPILMNIRSVARRGLKHTTNEKQEVSISFTYMEDGVLKHLMTDGAVREP